MPQLLRVIQLDASDKRIFDPAAEPGEWAVPGTFAFWDADLEHLKGSARQAFAHGFLGIPSFGRSTLVEVAEIDEQTLETVTLQLAEHLVACYGAPDTKTALPAAREEIRYAASLCNPHQAHTLITLDRELKGEEIIENFKRINPASGADHSHIPLWELVSQVDQETNEQDS